MAGWGWLLLLSLVSQSRATCISTNYTTVHASGANETLTLSCHGTQTNHPVITDYWEYNASGVHLIPAADCTQTALSSTCIITDITSGSVEMKLTHVIRPVPDEPVIKECIQLCHATIILPSSSTSQQITPTPISTGSGVTSTIYTTSISTPIVQHTTSSLPTRPTSGHVTHSDMTTATTITTTIATTPTPADGATNTAPVIAVVVIVVCLALLAIVITVVAVVLIWMKCRKKKPPVANPLGDLDTGFLVSPETQNFCSDEGIQDSKSHGRTRSSWDAFLTSNKRRISSLFKGKKKNSRTSLLNEDVEDADSATIETGLSTRNSNIPNNESSSETSLHREETIKRTNPLANPYALKQAHPLEIIHTATTGNVKQTHVNN